MNSNERDTTKLEEKSQDLGELLNPEIVEAGLPTTDGGILTVDDFQIMDAQMTSEVLSLVGGLYEPQVIYNYPKRSDKGKKSWKACKRMTYGCPYDGKDNHIHIVDVGIHGARIAAQTYGSLEYGAEGMPIVVEQGGKFYWVVEVKCQDMIRNLSVSHWQFQDMIIRGGGGSLTEIEHGAAIVQAKGLRKVILSVIPPQLRRVWITDYLEGKEAFDPEKVLALPGGRRGMADGNGNRTPPPTKPPEKKKEEPVPPTDSSDGESGSSGKDKPKRPPVAGSGASDLQAVIKDVADRLDVDPKRVTEFTTTYATMAQAMLELTRALGDQALGKKLKEKYMTWSEQNPAEET